MNRKTVLPPDNPWRRPLTQCLDGERYLRASEYRELIEYIDSLLLAQDRDVQQAFESGYEKGWDEGVAGCGGLS